MHAVRLHDAGDLRLDVVAPPAGLGPRQVLLAPLFTGICGTDLQWLSGSRPWRGAPQILGHECVGQVREVGPGMTAVSRGDRVAVIPIVACRRCPACLRGDEQLCPQSVTFGINHPWGGLAELAVTDEAQLVRLPREISTSRAVLAEPMAVALNGLDRAYESGRPARLLVCGGGPIGTLAALAAQLEGQVEVQVSEPDPLRVARLRHLGLQVLDAGALERESRTAGFDAAIEASGTAGALEDAITAVRRGGTVVVLAAAAEPVSVNLRKAFVKGLRLVTAFAYPLTDWRRPVELLASEDVPFDALISHRPRLEDLVPSLPKMVEPGRERMKIVVAIQDEISS